MRVDIKKRGLHRTKIIEGQIRGLHKLIYQEAHCMDILTQSLAIQKSLASLNKLMVENHITTHIHDMLSSGIESEKSKGVEELLKVYELNNIRSKS